MEAMETVLNVLAGTPAGKDSQEYWWKRQMRTQGQNDKRNVPTAWGQQRPVSFRRDRALNNRERAPAIGISATEQSGKIYTAYQRGTGGPVMYLPSQIGLEAQRAMAHGRANMLFKEIPFQGQNNSSRPWNIRWARSLPWMDHGVAEVGIPAKGVSGIGPYERTTPMGLSHTPREFHFIGPMSRVGRTFQRAPSIPIFRPHLDRQVQAARTEAASVYI
jgi:hypothetical protein